MLFQSVHTAGSAIYLVYFFLLLLASRVPRTNPGCGWWALAILFAFLARIAVLGIESEEIASSRLAYSVLVLFEKLMLMLGTARFFGPWLSARTLIALVLVMQSWLLLAHALTWPPLLYTASLVLFNVICLAIVCINVQRGTAPVHLWIKRSIVLFGALLILHWLLYIPISRLLFVEWRLLAFLIGTVLVVLLYTALLGAVLSLFQKRLLDSESKALDLAYKDPLTGLRNKRYVDSLFGQALQLATRPHQLLALYYIDLDHFKPINDGDGHKAGDLVLQEVARRLQNSIRSTDICARIGGDEFVVIATQLEHSDHATGVAQKILQLLQQPFAVNGKTYRLGASIGISLYPEHGQDFSDLLEKADHAMYEMKHHGRGGYCLYQPQA
ncbi:GGDEF domain-containing protein [Alkalimonas delamerensis]|uniref:GGDEF domain-containing protein n=1 Tax=Alkalimonas delamerensis TaxID=265981 RepID=A0ABT9GQQ1_9GAMM|nr:GGDEF domain-containing protein [Alkalimonas delamerensis]MDP4529307.1 GGDEF domain-containing protein [Alkalimonas delamerensis]